MTKKAKIPTDAASCILYYYFKSIGGMSRFAEISGYTKQNIFNWRRLGKIPILKAVKLAETLNIDPYILNYRDYGMVVGKYPNWRKFVVSLGFPKSITEDILRLEPPV